MKPPKKVPGWKDGPLTNQQIVQPDKPILSGQELQHQAVKDAGLRPKDHRTRADVSSQRRAD